MSDDWGPWIDHDGSGCPCVGMPVELAGPHRCQVDRRPGRIAKGGASWYWTMIGGMPCSGNPFVWPILRYRIRRPRGMEILDRILAGVDAPIREDA